MLKVLTVQDLSCAGKCSLTVALPIISALGIEVLPLPTALLSCHTAFKAFSYFDLTATMKTILNDWEKEGIKFDCLYTGYLGKEEHIDLLQALIAKMRGVLSDKGTTPLVLIDPCLADNGVLYKGFNKDYVTKMKTLLEEADVITPNISEAAFLLNLPYRKEYDEKYIDDLLTGLKSFNANIVLKGLEYTTSQEHLQDVKGKIGVAYYTKEEGCKYYFHNKVTPSFHGTGDIFASVLVSLLLKKESLDDAVKTSCAFVEKSIKLTVESKNYNWYGVDFEKAIPYLLNKTLI